MLFLLGSVNADEDKELWSMTMQQQIQMAATLEKEMQEEQEKVHWRMLQEKVIYFRILVGGE